MGQYYNVIARNKDGSKSYNLQTKMFEETNNFNYYNGLKLMEHSWWRNDFCCAFAETLVDNPTRVCWCGDYAEEDECEALGFTYDEVWNNDDEIAVTETDFNMSSVKYLINNDKKVFVDLEKY